MGWVVWIGCTDPFDKQIGYGIEPRPNPFRLDPPFATSNQWMGPSYQPVEHINVALVDPRCLDFPTGSWSYKCSEHHDILIHI